MFKKLTAIVLVVLIGLILITRPSQATVSYHYRYQLLTQGQSYPTNTNLEIKLYVNATGEQIQNAAAEVTYDSNALALREVKKWNLFDIDANTETSGKISIQGKSNTLFSGEAPLAYLYFTTKTAVSDLTQVLTVSNGVVVTTAPPTTTPTIGVVNPTPTPTVIQPTVAATATPAPTANCPIIEGSGPYTLVIIPDHYSNLDDFVVDARKAIAELKKSNLPAAGIAKFTFRYLADTSKDYQIVVRPDRTLNQDTNLIKASQLACNGNGALVISKKFTNLNESYGTGGFSGLYSNITVVFPFSLMSAVHEMGHGMAGLFDEYSLNTTSTSSPIYYNCAGEDQLRCQEWANKYAGNPKIGCFRTCGHTNWYRSTEFSAMNNNLDYLYQFNPPSLEVWNNFFAKY